MSGKLPEPKIVVGIPGRWEDRSEIVTSIASLGGGYLFAGNMLMNRESGKGFEIDVYRDEIVDEDVELSEFTDDIDEWIIDELKSIGCDTAKSVLELSVEELLNRTDLEEETIIEVRTILFKEFED